MFNVERMFFLFFLGKKTPSRLISEEDFSKVLFFLLDTGLDGFTGQGLAVLGLWGEGFFGLFCPIWPKK